jgi:hypothetical protein
MTFSRGISAPAGLIASIHVRQQEFCGESENNREDFTIDWKISVKLRKLSGGEIGRGANPWPQYTPGMKIDIARYGERTWAVYIDGRLLCVTLYKAGATAVKGFIEQMLGALQYAQQGVISRQMRQPVNPGPGPVSG